MKGTIFNIQRFSVNDGPGIRTTVFAKGCNLRCRWCHNPESISSRQEIQYFPEKCIMCGKCLDVCPEGAHYINSEGGKVFDRDKCRMCGLCIQHCLYDALVFVAKDMQPDEVVEVVMKDSDYYQNSGGGLTISGGEPLLQKEFVKRIFEKTHALGIHNALDTAANIDWSVIEYVLPVVDLVLLDLKVMDPEIHKRFTGVSNKKILQNAKQLAQQAIDLIVRIPVIAGFNATEDNMNQTAAFLKDFPRLQYVELLSYHDLGLEKYTSLGQKNDEHDVFATPSNETMETLAWRFREYDIQVKVE